MFKAPESLDDYLSQVARELRVLPNRARDEELREIEAHLRALVEARQGDEAGALKQFGPARRVGRNLRKAWERKQPEAWWRAALALILIELVFYMIIIPMYEGYARFFSGLALRPPINFVLFWCFALLILFIIPIVTGFVVGLISPKRGHIAVFIASLLTSTMEWLNPQNYFNFSDFTAITLLLIFYFSSVLSAILGLHLGARRGRKRHAQIVNSRR